MKKLEALETEMNQLNERVIRLETTRLVQTDLSITVDDLLKLPDSLRRTMIAITRLKEEQAEVVAKQTGSTRGMENIYLNQLVRMGYLEKVRRGRRVFFRTLRAI